MAHRVRRRREESEAAVQRGGAPLPPVSLLLASLLASLLLLTIPNRRPLRLTFQPYAYTYTHASIQLPEALNVSILTWNMGEKSPPLTDVAALAGMGLNSSDLAVLGVQEVSDEMF